MNKTGLLGLFYVGLLQATCQLAMAQSSEELINRMAEATRTLDYEGIFVFSHGDKMDVMRILHKNDENGEREKIIALTGHAREIIRNNDTVTCIFPDTQEVMVERSRARGFAGKITDAVESIAENYDFSTVGEDRIAGRDAWIVKIMPRDQFRYGYQLWIDKDNHLLLKSRMHDDEGEPLELVMFTELELPEFIADDRFNPSITGKEYTRYQYTQQGESNAAIVADERQNWRVTWLPAGFRLSVYDNKTPSDNNNSLEHMIYTDGISTVSIFIEMLADDSSIKTGSMSLGAVNVYSRMTDGFQVTAVGEVPTPTVMRMVDSVVPRQ